MKYLYIFLTDEKISFILKIKIYKIVEFLVINKKYYSINYISKKIKLKK